MTPSVLALSLFFHISATIIWIGGLLVTILLVWPASRHALAGTPALYRFLGGLRRRFYPISNLCLGVLIVTGLFQMTADPNYDGVMQFTNDWTRIMLAKHILVFVMAGAGLLLQLGVAPALERTSLLLEYSKGDSETNERDWQRLRQREVRLTWLCTGLGVFIVGLSVWASRL